LMVLSMRVVLACGHERILSHGFPLKRKYRCPKCRTQQVVVHVCKGDAMEALEERTK